MRGENKQQFVWIDGGGYSLGSSWVDGKPTYFLTYPFLGRLGLFGVLVCLFELFF